MPNEDAQMSLVPKEQEAAQPSLMHIIQELARHPSVDGIAALERLVALKERTEERQAKTEYIAAMARLAPLLPIVERNGHVKYEGTGGKQGMDRTYGKYEDIDEAVRPIYSAEGFSVAWKTEEGQGGKIRMIGVCSHRMGHSEEFKIDLPHDSSGGKNAIQAIGSSVLGYGRRMLTTMIFNVRIAGADMDGEDTTLLSEDQIKDVETLLQDTSTKTSSFLEKIAGYNSIAEIPASQYRRCMNALEAKLRTISEKNKS